MVDKRTYRLYFNHPETNEALTNMFKALNADKSIEGLEMADSDDNTLFEASREDFAPMALSSSVPQPDSREILEEAILYVIKPSFERKLKWEVLYHGMRIPATVRDEQFLDRVERGEEIRQGRHTDRHPSHNAKVGQAIAYLRQ